MTCVDRSVSGVCQRCQSTDCGHMDRGHIVTCHVVECHENGYPVVIGGLRPRVSGLGYRAGGIEPGVSSLGYRAWGIEPGVSSLGYRAWVVFCIKFFRWGISYNPWTVGRTPEALKTENTIDGTFADRRICTPSGPNPQESLATFVALGRYRIMWTA